MMGTRFCDTYIHTGLYVWYTGAGTQMHINSNHWRSIYTSFQWLISTNTILSLERYIRKYH